MPFDTVAKNEAANAIAVDRIRLHSGDPGATGSANAVGTAMACVFVGASAGLRALQANVNFTGLASNQAVSWFSIRLSTGDVFKGRAQITNGDLQANVAGEYTLTTATTIGIID